MNGEFRHYLEKRLLILGTEERMTMALLDQLNNGVGSSSAIASSIRPIIAPVGRFKTTPDWIIGLLTKYANGGLKRGQIVDCLAPKIKSRARNREKAVMDALSLLVRSRQVEEANGVYRLSEPPGQ
jgi:hypothetical protein